MAYNHEFEVVERAVPVGLVLVQRRKQRKRKKRKHTQQEKRECARQRDIMTACKKIQYQIPL